MTDDFVERLEQQLEMKATEIVGRDFRSLHQHFLERFFQSAKLRTGRWVSDGFRWHAYYRGHEEALSGDPAFELYMRQAVKPFYMYHEGRDRLFDCTAPRWPDVRALHDDIYVFPHGMDWLFSASHEGAPSAYEIGPFFATPYPKGRDRTGLCD